MAHDPVLSCSTSPYDNTFCYNKLYFIQRIVSDLSIFSLKAGMVFNVSYVPSSGMAMNFYPLKQDLISFISCSLDSYLRETRSLNNIITMSNSIIHYITSIMFLKYLSC